MCHDVRNRHAQRRCQEPGSDGTGEALRDHSRHVLMEAAALRELETAKRNLAVGSPEFAEIAAEITRRAKALYRRAAEQQRVGESGQAADTTIEDMDPRSPSV